MLLERTQNIGVSIGSFECNDILTSVLRTENQFISHRVPVKPLLRQGSNELLITFASAFRKVYAAHSSS